MDEEWRTVGEAPSYEVSSMGRVRSKKTGRHLKVSKNAQGVPKVTLRDAGFTITRSVRAMAKEAFKT